MSVDWSSDYRVVDLSVTVSEDLPSYWPGHMPFASKVWNYFQPTEILGETIPSFAPYQTRFWVIDEHCGTHFDGPTHFIPPDHSGLPWAGERGAETGDKVPLTDFMGPGVCLDVRHLRHKASVDQGQSPWIHAEDIRTWEVNYGGLNPGEVVLFYTGWDQHYRTDREGRQYAHNPLVLKTGEAWPAPDVESMLYLYSRGIRCVGTDAPSMGAAHDGVPVHQEGLSRGMRFIEVLSDLGQLSPRGFFFIFLPIKVKGSTGGPGRAIAMTPTRSPTRSND